MIVEHRYRRNTSSQWAALNPVLAAGEPALELDTGHFKLGDGHTRWADLPHFAPEDLVPGASDEAVNAHINAALPHPVYDDGPSFLLLYLNAKV